MNKITDLFRLILFSALISCSGPQNKEYEIEEIPQPIQRQIDMYFPGKEIVKASFDDHAVYKKYKITLTDHVSLEFNTKFEVIEMKSDSELPDTLIPKEIRNYVEINYPQHVIHDWQSDHGIQQIELDNGTDLEFTSEGQFIRVQD